MWKEFNEQYCTHSQRADERYWNCSIRKNESLLGFVDRMNNLYYEGKIQSRKEDHVRRIVQKSKDQDLIVQISTIHVTSVEQLRKIIKNRDKMLQNMKTKSYNQHKQPPGTQYLSEVYHGPDLRKSRETRLNYVEEVDVTDDSKSYSSEDEDYSDVPKAYLTKTLCKHCNGNHKSEFCYKTMQKHQCNICNGYGHFEQHCTQYCSICKKGHAEDEVCKRDVQELIKLLQNKHPDMVQKIQQVLNFQARQ